MILNVDRMELRNEVRNGNWIQNGYGDLRVIGGMTDDATWQMSEARYGKFKPIDLTRDWLLKMGFSEIKNECYVNNIQYILQVDGSGLDSTCFDGIGTIKQGELVVNVLCKGNYVCNSLDYVHQIQNLYYELKREELIIKSIMK